ncbi:MAG: flippase-like domain-containing protein [Elusimicrobia bacterium]|nr:flippase-like domain-containing protein [Elusimicrobiota bacterium]
MKESWSKVKRQAAVAAGGVLSLAILAWLVIKSLHPLLHVVSGILWGWVAAGLFCALSSYAMVGLALGQILSLLGFSQPLAELLGVALVSTTANYFISSAGLSGFALKAYLLRKRHVPYGVTVTASVLSSAILYIVLAVILGQGLIYLVYHLGGGRLPVMESALGMLILLGVAVLILGFFFNHKLRNRLSQKLFHALNHAVFYFSKAEIPREAFEEFESQLNRGLSRVRQHKKRLTKTVVYTGLDWCLAMLALYCSFRAVGVSLDVGHLSAGFTAGQAATFIPLLPGGLGVLEGSMAAVFQGLGVSWEQALMGALLYRLTYYLIPGLMSVFVLWGLSLARRQDHPPACPLRE